MKKITKFRYKILPEKNLIIDSFTGVFTFLEIIELAIQQSQDPEWKEHYDVLADIRNARFIYNKEEIKNLPEYTLKGLKVNVQRKSAAITSEPKQVVFEQMLQLLKNPEVPIEINVFSTVDAALKWIGIFPDENEDIMNILEGLLKD